MSDVTVPMTIGKFAIVHPAGIKTVVGTCAAFELDEREMVVPPAGVGV